MGTSLRITSVIVFLIGVHLVVPKISDAAMALSTSTVRNTVTTQKTDLPSNTEVSFSNESNSDYQPQNYGGPDSVYGSGTR